MKHIQPSSGWKFKRIKKKGNFQIEVKNQSTTNLSQLISTYVLETDAACNLEKTFLGRNRFQRSCL